LLPDAPDLQANLLYLLACDAVRKASYAFNDGNLEISAQLAELAMEIFPEVARSTPWRKLAMKRWMGLKAWRVLQCLRTKKDRRTWLVPVPPHP
jgi:hypothetical protein